MIDKKIIVLHITFNMGIGGTEQVIRQIVDNSDHDQFEHKILCIDGFVGPIGQELAEAGVEIIVTKKKPGLDFALMVFIRRLLKEKMVNILHCHQYSPYFYGVLGALLTRCKVILTEHGRFYPERHNIKRRIINPVLAYFTYRITAISNATAKAVHTYEYIDEKKIEVIYNGIRELDYHDFDLSMQRKELGLSDQYRYIGTISRLEPIKNQSMMIRAFSQVKEKIPDVRLIIIGDGSIKVELEQLVAQLGLEDEIIFTGFLNNPQRYIKLFEMFLLSSFSEGTSMTLLEAMSLSVPCVVTDVGGNSELIVNEESGLVVPSNNEEEFASAILNLIGNKAMAISYGQKGKIIFNGKFTVSSMIENYESIYTR